MPWTACLVKFNPIIGYFVTENSKFPLWCLKQIQKRLATQPSVPNPTPAPQKKDFMTRFLDAAKTSQPPGYNIPQVLNWLLVNTMAGADTTAFVLTAILYYLLRSPSKKAILLQELDAANLSYPVSWQQSQHLPYLSACIKEGLRLHPPIGMGLERVVPPAGLAMPDGYVLPAGTHVSMNPWIVNRQPAVFGERVDDFIPERWMKGKGEEEAEYKRRVGRMKRADLVFGGGVRACTGKYVSFLEMYKVLPTLLGVFEVGLVDEGEWETVNRWVVRQEGVRCWLRRRGKG